VEEQRTGSDHRITELAKTLCSKAWNPPKKLRGLSPPGNLLTELPILVGEVSAHTHIYIYIYRVSQEECARLREGVPYGKVYRYNPKHLCPKLNGYGDNGQRKVWSTCGSTLCTYQLTSLSMSVLECGVALRHCLPVMCHVQVLGNLRSVTTCLRVVL
jgi:hypothetical protein